LCKPTHDDGINILHEFNCVYKNKSPEPRMHIPTPCTCPCAHLRSPALTASSPARTPFAMDRCSLLWGSSAMALVLFVPARPDRPQYARTPQYSRSAKAALRWFVCCSFDHVGLCGMDHDAWRRLHANIINERKSGRISDGRFVVCEACTARLSPCGTIHGAPGRWARAARPKCYWRACFSAPSRIVSPLSGALRVACCMLRVACCMLRVACCMLRVACCMLRVAFMLR
jgi:hypothetical protein